MNVYNEKIAALNKQIAEKNEIINQYQKEIDALQAEIEGAVAEGVELLTLMAPAALDVDISHVGHGLQAVAA